MFPHLKVVQREMRFDESLAHVILDGELLVQQMDQDLVVVEIPQRFEIRGLFLDHWRDIALFPIVQP